MTVLETRIKKIERSANSTRGEKYRDLCFAYNLRLLSDNDLQSSILSCLSGQPIPVQIKERLYAPIPDGAPKHAIRQAKMVAAECAHMTEMHSIDLQRSIRESLSVLSRHFNLFDLEEK